MAPRCWSRAWAELGPGDGVPWQAAGMSPPTLAPRLSCRLIAAGARLGSDWKGPKLQPLFPLSEKAARSAAEAISGQSAGDWHVRSSAPACRCWLSPSPPAQGPLPCCRTPCCRVHPAVPPLARLHPCASSPPRAGTMAPGLALELYLGTGAVARSRGTERIHHTAPVPPLQPRSRGTSSSPAAPRSWGRCTAPAAAPPRCLFSPALIKLLERVFFLSPHITRVTFGS